MVSEIPFKLHHFQALWLEHMKSTVVQCCKCKKSMKAIESKIRFFHRRYGGIGMWYFCEKHYEKERTDA